MKTITDHYHRLRRAHKEYNAWSRAYDGLEITFFGYLIGRALQKIFNTK